MRRDDERPASCPPGLLSGDPSTLFAPPSTDSCSPVIVVDIRLCYYHAAFNLDEETADFVNQPRDCIVLPEQPLAELSKIDLKFFYQHIKPETRFMLCLDIDDTVLHLGMSVAFGEVRLNHNLFKFIDELLAKGYIFSVKFVTARCNYEELVEHKEDANMDPEWQVQIERITTSNFSVLKLSALFQQRFPGIDFLGVSYSTFYSKKNGSYDKESYEKVKVLEGLKKKHGFPVVLIDNNLNELDPVYSRASKKILGIQCFDIPCITNEQLLKLKNGRTFHEENPYRHHRRNCSI